MYLYFKTRLYACKHMHVSAHAAARRSDKLQDKSRDNRAAAHRRQQLQPTNCTFWCPQKRIRICSRFCNVSANPPPPVARASRNRRHFFPPKRAFFGSRARCVTAVQRQGTTALTFATSQMHLETAELLRRLLGVDAPAMDGLEVFAAKALHFNTTP